MGKLWHYFPRGRRLPALERNILKYRAFEMIVVLFHIEDLRTFVLQTIRANDEQAIPEGVKKPYEKAWAYLVAKGVITEEESEDLRKLTDYRNTIAHDIQKLTYDLSQEEFAVDWGVETVQYDYSALRRLRQYRSKIGTGLRHMILPLSYEHLMFEAAERTLEQELSRLRKKIDKLFALRQAEMRRLQDEVAALENGELERIGLYHPGNRFGQNGKLTTRGVHVCEALFQRDISPLAASYLMRISFPATKRRYKAWKSSQG